VFSSNTRRWGEPRKGVIIIRLYEYNAWWKFEFFICYVNYILLEHSRLLRCVAGLLITDVRKERTAFVCMGWRGRRLRSFGTSGINSPATRRNTPDDLTQYQRRGNLKSYIFIVTIPFNYEDVSLKIQHSERKGETTLKYAYAFVSAAKFPALT
jgi:hypothetical protein